MSGAYHHLSRRGFLQTIGGGAVAVASAPLLAACGSSSGGAAAGAKTLTVAYWSNPAVFAGQLLNKTIPAFKKANPGWNVKLVPIAAAESDYYTKLDLMNKSASTSADVMFEDTFLINSDVAAGYLAPLDSYVNNWSAWDQFLPAAKTAAQGQDGKIYGVPLGGGTAGLWYDKQLLTKAGITVPWAPKNWNDVLTAARAVKKSDSGVTPINIYVGTPAGEYSSLWGFQMLLYSTGEQLYDHSTNKWILPGKGFTDSLTLLKTIYGQNLAIPAQQALNANITSTVPPMMQQGKLAINLDGGWLAGSVWEANNTWPQWSTALGWTGWPTQNGQAPGVMSMDGGWTLSIGARSQNKSQAFDFIKTATDTPNAVYYDRLSGNLADQKSVAADPAYTKGQPGIEFWTNLGTNAYYRPAYSVYPQISTAIQKATEQVVTGEASPAQAASTYASTLKQIVGADKTQAA